METADRPQSLRERKKVRTRDAIRRAALDLVEANGYANTTVEQIANAAEVSHATFFRYFPSKGVALISDEIDRLFIDTLASQPADVPTAQAYSRAIEAVGATLSDDNWKSVWRRRELIFSIPELRDLQFAQHRRTACDMAEVECRRLGRTPGDFDVEMYFNAMCDAGLAVLGDDPNVPDRLYRVVEFIDNVLPL